MALQPPLGVGTTVRIATYNVGVGSQQDPSSNHPATQHTTRQQIIISSKAPPSSQSPFVHVIRHYATLQDWGRKNGKLHMVIADIVALLKKVDVLLVQEWGDHIWGCPHNAQTSQSEARRVRHTASLRVDRQTSNTHPAEDRLLQQGVEDAGLPHSIIHDQAYVCLAYFPGFQPPFQQYPITDG